MATDPPIAAVQLHEALIKLHQDGHAGNTAARTTMAGGAVPDRQHAATHEATQEAAPANRPTRTRSDGDAQFAEDGVRQIRTETGA